MGVDHSAFMAYGAKVDLMEGYSADDVAEWLDGTGKDLNLNYQEWGAWSYGGDGGLIVGDKGFMASYDFDDLGDLGSLGGRTNPPSDTMDRLQQAVKRGAPFTIDGQVRWWVGALTW